MLISESDRSSRIITALSAAHHFLLDKEKAKSIVEAQVDTINSKWDQVAQEAGPAAPTTSILNLPDVNGLSVDSCMAQIRAGHEWHKNMVKLTGHWVNAGWSDEEILLAAEGLTLTGYTAAQTHHEVIKMLHGARSKWAFKILTLFLMKYRHHPFSH